MKKIITSLFFSLCVVMAVNAQTSVDEIAIRKKIVSVSEKVSSVKCDFVQTRQSSLLKNAVVSKGNMEYRRPGFLRWKYISPKNMEFCVEGHNVSLKIDGNPQPAGNQDRVVKEMSRMIMGNIEGSSLLDESLFKNSIKQEKGEVIVVLFPQNSNFKKMCKELVLTYNAKDFTIKSFVMKELSGDITTIIFSSAKYEFSE